MFEKAVELDPTDKDALGDLLDYYLEAPGFLGGGMHKAEILAQMILKQDPAEGHYAQGLVADKKKEYDAAEQQFRRAVELAPRQVGRVLVLARYLANHGRVKESDALFEQAARMAPNNPRVMFDRATTYIKENRDLDARAEAAGAICELASDAGRSAAGAGRGNAQEARSLMRAFPHWRRCVLVWRRFVRINFGPSLRRWAW